jgi:hypothetical protein
VGRSAAPKDAIIQRFAPALHWHRPCIHRGGKIPNPDALMVYVLAIFAPPLGLLFNGQPLAAVLNVALIVPCVLLGLVFHVLWLVPSLHAVISVYMRREQRRHREIVEAIERHGPPP